VAWIELGGQLGVFRTTPTRKAATAAKTKVDEWIEKLLADGSAQSAA
jgi:hypothetical protein